MLNLVIYCHLTRLAAEYDLHPVYREEFHDVFSDHQDHAEFGPLMVRMRVVDANGESSMDEDQWEAASMSNTSFTKPFLTHSFRHLYRVCFREAIDQHIILVFLVSYVNHVN